MLMPLLMLEEMQGLGSSTLLGKSLEGGSPEGRLS